ncbi:MAG: hypothetical protein JXR03_08895 [Cyclobacteriaceae bacterium]
MQRRKKLDELENLITFFIAALILSGFFYYLIDSPSNNTEGFSRNSFLFLKRFLIFCLGGTFASIIQFVKTKKWDFKWFFWINVLVMVLYTIFDIATTPFFQ